MCAACHAATKLLMFDARARERVVNLIRAAGLPTTLETLNIDALLNAIRRDKKSTTGRARFILPTSIGSVVVRDDVPEQVVRDAFASLFNAKR
jgi:3-dehydroquinate synthase